MNLTDAIGWASALVLLLTLQRQIYNQWRSDSIAGVSRWLFVGQATASLGFLIYSYLLENTVFILTNALLLLTAIGGQCIYWYKKNRSAQKE